MTRQELTEFIREQIMELAVNEYKKSKNPPVVQPKKEEIVSEDELDNILFFGGADPTYEKNPITIKENQEGNKVKITTSEIKAFEDNFKKNVSPLVAFDKQQNNYSLFLYKGPSGLEAKSSGIIKINSTNEIKWKFSIQEGANVLANLKLDEDNYELISKLYQFFDTWQTEWSNKLSGTVQDLEGTAPAPAPAAPLPAPTA